MISKLKAKVEVDKYSTLEECLRAIKWKILYDSISMANLYLVLDIVVLKKFKILEFDKYTGTQYPILHLAIYRKNMVEVIHGEKLLCNWIIPKSII